MVRAKTWALCTLITFPIFGMAHTIYSNWQTKDFVRNQMVLDQCTERKIKREGSRERERHAALAAYVWVCESAERELTLNISVLRLQLLFTTIFLVAGINIGQKKEEEWKTTIKWKIPRSLSFSMHMNEETPDGKCETGRGGQATAAAAFRFIWDYDGVLDVNCMTKRMFAVVTFTREHIERCSIHVKNCNNSLMIITFKNVYGR